MYKMLAPKDMGLKASRDDLDTFLNLRKLAIDRLTVPNMRGDDVLGRGASIIPDKSHNLCVFTLYVNKDGNQFDLSSTQFFRPNSLLYRLLVLDISSKNNARAPDSLRRQRRARKDEV